MSLKEEMCDSTLTMLLSADERKELSREIPAWLLGDRVLEREISFPDFRKAIDFIGGIAGLAEQQQHHPDITISYTTVRLTLSTRKVDGLTRNDFILAAKIDGLVREHNPFEIRHDAAELSLHGLTALVTGAAKRIGREIASSLAAHGINVVIHYNKSMREAESLADELRECGVNAWTLQADIADGQGAAALVGRARECGGALDILVNNASIFPPRTIRNADYADLSENVRINAWAPFILGREFNRIAGKGVIINLLDSRIFGYDRMHVGYIASKHLLFLLTRMMALEFAPDIRVNAVAPGLILPPPGKDYAYLDSLAGTNPLKRHGDPRDVAQAVVFLIRSGFITGQVVCVDGGRHLKEYGGATEAM